MRILILSQYFYPEPEAIPFELATGLAERGHEVIVATGFPNYPYGRIFAGYRQQPWKKEAIQGVKVCRFPLYPDRSRSILGRCLYYLSLSSSISLLGNLFCGRIDIIFVYHPITLGLSAYWIGLLHRAPFVINIQDMYPESLSATSIADNNIAIQIVSKLAKFVYQKAAAIAVISNGFRQNLLLKGVASEKIHVILNWANENLYVPMPRDESLAASCGMGGRFNAVYAGSMGPPQGLHSVIEAAFLLRDVEDMQFVLIGDGMDKSELEALAERRKMSNVIFLPRQPASRIASFYALADILIVHLRNKPLFEITIPSKIQSYLAFGRPILIGVKGEAADLVMKAGAGVKAEPSNPADIARGILQIYNMSEKDRERMGNAGRHYFFQNLTMKKGIDSYENLFKAVILEKGGKIKRDEGNGVSNGFS
jgi:colanic acid biosynthesis glycosyl transferase WcaI